MANEYKSFYLKDLKDTIDRVTVDVIRENTTHLAGTDSTGDCPLRHRLAGIFDMADRMKKALEEEEDD
jgi:hypothetical protein